VPKGYSQGVGINSSVNNPHPSAMLDVSGQSTGVLINRMTTAQRDAIANPAPGLSIYNTDCENFNYYTSEGWRPLNNNHSNVDQAGWINGNTEVCTGDMGVSFTTNAVANATSYSWNYTGQGLTIASDPTSNSIEVNFGPNATSGFLRVSGLNACGIGNPANLNITVYSSPVAVTANAAQGVSVSSFNASWSTSPQAWGYYLDVATDAGFSSVLPAYNGLNVGNTDSYVVSGLNSNTPYFYRVRSWNNCGTSSNSNVISLSTTVPCSGTLTDSRDGQVYPIVQIGPKCWMKENLNYDQSAFGNDYCYENNPANCTANGRLYEWSAAMQGASSAYGDPSGVQGVCPSGWHMPSDAEWCVLENTVQPGVNPGCGNTGWLGSTLGIDLQAGGSSGFDALLGGYYYTPGGWTYLGYDGAFWTASEAGGSNAWSRVVEFESGSVLRSNYDKTRGYSVRCVKD
jgi:uncharacterized protein (TIGR02145 family)